MSCFWTWWSNSSISRTLLILCVITLSGQCSGSILSQGNIVSCASDVEYASDFTGQAQATDTLRTCSEKIGITLALRGGQSGTESILANVKEVINGSKKATLTQPIRILLSKSEVELRYNVLYRGSAWNSPSEQVVRKDHRDYGLIVDDACKDGYWEEESKVACGFRYTNRTGKPERIFYSQGYCCACTQDGKYNDQQYDRSRDIVQCAVFGDGQAAAHCFDPDRNDKLTYDIFDVGPPFVVFNINVQVQYEQNSGQPNSLWVTMAEFDLSPSSLVGRSADGRVLAEFLGDLYVPSTYTDLSYKNYIAPHYDEALKDHPQVKAGIREHMFVDKHFVDVDGLTCDTIGVSYYGFYKQRGRCQQRFGSCLDNQPVTFWRKDTERRKMGLPSLYFTAGVGEPIPQDVSSTTRLLAFKYDLRHQSIVRLELDADNLQFVMNSSPGVIDTVTISDFQALSSRGNLSVTIHNTGNLTADYTIGTTDCGTSIAEVPGKSVTVKGGEFATRMFSIFTHDPRGSDYRCEVLLYNQQNELIDSQKVSFKTTDTCFCLGVCGCTCWEDGIQCPTFEAPRKKSWFEKVYDYVLMILNGKYGPLILVGFLFGLGLLRSFVTQLACCRLNKTALEEDEEDEAVRLNRMLNLDTTADPEEEEEKTLSGTQKVLKFLGKLLYFFYAPILLVLRILLGLFLVIKAIAVRSRDLFLRIQRGDLHWRKILRRKDRRSSTQRVSIALSDMSRSDYEHDDEVSDDETASDTDYRDVEEGRRQSNSKDGGEQETSFIPLEQASTLQSAANKAQDKSSIADSVQHGGSTRKEGMLSESLTLRQKAHCANGSSGNLTEGKPGPRSEDLEE